MKSKRRILVVDDDESLRRVVQFQLEQRGYEVRTASGGAQALHAHIVGALQVHLSRRGGPSRARKRKNRKPSHPRTWKCSALRAHHSSNDRHCLAAGRESSKGIYRCCATESAHRAVVHGALAMAWTAIDLARESRLRNRLITGS